MTILSAELFSNMQQFCFYMAGGLMSIAIVLMPFLYIFVGRKFDKLFKHKEKDDPIGRFDPGFIILNQIQLQWFTLFVFSSTSD